jgi:two-component system chemotaxis response regulator CheB
MSKIRVLSVDDSALMRQIMTEIINSHSDMEMVATAPDPLVARDLIKKYNPDVLTLDVEMPRMDGIDFLEKLMRLRPMPVVMVSSLTGKGSEITLRALELGAVDFVTKPQLGIREGMLAYSEMIAEKIRTASRAQIAAHKPISAPATLKAGPLLSSEKLLVIGASTGGTEAIRHVLQPLPLSSPGILITQHMPPGFTRSFAERLNKLCQISVKEAEDGERVLPGHAYIAPGDKHMELARSGANYQIKIHDGPPVNRHRPSVDVLFHSVAKHAGRNAVGVILTGMGNDGAAGMLAMHQAGAWTIAQNEASCVVFGMPREAINMGGVSEVVDLSQVSQQMLAKISAGQAIRYFAGGCCWRAEVLTESADPGGYCWKRRYCGAAPPAPPRSARCQAGSRRSGSRDRA